jgi:hypothetical protein
MILNSQHHTLGLLLMLKYVVTPVTGYFIAQTY